MVPDAQEKSGLAEIKPGVLDAAARQAYAVVFDARRDTTGGLGTLESELAGAQFFDVVVNGETVARYALQSVTRAAGVEVFIVGAAGNVKGADLTLSVLPHIEQQCAAADRLTVNTRRRGLVKKLLGQGWTLDSFVLRKKLHGRQVK